MKIRSDRHITNNCGTRYCFGIVNHYSVMVDIDLWQIPPEKTCGSVKYAERLKKIKANRETFSFKADKLIIYNFFFTTSLSVYSELLTAFQNQFTLKSSPFRRG